MLKLVDVYALWCGPCKVQAGVIEDIEKTHPEIKVEKLDADNSGSSEFIDKWHVRNIPALFLFDEETDELLWRTAGLTDRAKLEAAIRQALPQEEDA